MTTAKTTTHDYLRSRFKHFCDDCKFVGRIRNYDVWIHLSPKIATFVKRYSSRPADYDVASFSRTPKVTCKYTDALDLAKKRGIL